MGISEARKKANEKYIKQTFDEIKVRVPKGKKEKIQAYVQTKDESLNSFINRAIDEAMGRYVSDEIKEGE